ncbi:hypothetical protein CEUSTIGMA_g13979.t1 [Chlamydomonas eustigma]|uniref:Uncharacterized protein n=1 Tax=Chlamydomonas eustigma TaxID=1157962 RepID=A0A250XUH3_9CHLO|nr:hypothetical protein CEUSTIGMA_g13979.t1 [Chlamydomonas eustigma]|eukprot:GAX86572.1 hypothetical protein CEUSTIGMA_g13979.t1 [Chlamydomonas eustigma]
MDNLTTAEKDRLSQIRILYQKKLSLGLIQIQQHLTFDSVPQVKRRENSVKIATEPQLPQRYSTRLHKSHMAVPAVSSQTLTPILVVKQETSKSIAGTMQTLNDLVSSAMSVFREDSDDEDTARIQEIVDVLKEGGFTMKAILAKAAIPDERFWDLDTAKQLCLRPAEVKSLVKSTSDLITFMSTQGSSKGPTITPRVLISQDCTLTQQEEPCGEAHVASFF